ncbi:unnamed protein product, partial [Rotaria sp. Silwood2]
MLIIISYNIGGITTCGIQALLRSWLKETPHDVILLQELHMTKIKHLDIFRNAFPDYNITCSLGTWTAGGTLVMIKKKYDVIDASTDPDGRTAFIKIIYEKILIITISAYAPAQITERFRATNPTENNMIQLDIIRKDIHRILEEKISNNILGQQEQDAKSLSIFARARIAHTKSNQSRITFLEHPLKGRVESSIDMIETATNFYEELYDIKTIDRTCWNELFADIPPLIKHDSDNLERDIILR